MMSALPACIRPQGAIVRLFSLCVAVLVLSGCDNSCKGVCTKLSDCELESQLIDIAQCETACTTQLVAVESEDNSERTTAFTQHRNCLATSTCEELTEGICYDEQFFSF